jgi:hypothetical protein
MRITESDCGSGYNDMSASASVAGEIISLFERAAEANRTTPCRCGNVVRLPSQTGGEVLITADLHGNWLNYDRILALADLDSHPLRHLVLQEVCHGGPSYPVDGGCMSHLLVEEVARLKLQYPERVHFLLSNHELAEATDFVVAKGGRLLNMHFRCGLREMYGGQAEEVHQSLKKFLLSCPLALRIGNEVFVSHSLPAKVDRCPFYPGVLDAAWTEDDLSPDGAVFRLVWGRDFRRENAETFAEMVKAKVLIHGHEPCVAGYQVPNDLQVIIDGSGPEARYLLLPLDRPLSHADVVKRVERLHA